MIPARLCSKGNVMRFRRRSIIAVALVAGISLCGLGVLWFVQPKPVRVLRANYETLTRYAADVADDKIEPRTPLLSPVGKLIIVPVGDELMGHGVSNVYREGDCVVMIFGMVSPNIIDRLRGNGEHVSQALVYCTSVPPDRWQPHSESVVRVIVIDDKWTFVEFEVPAIPLSDRAQAPSAPAGRGNKSGVRGSKGTTPFPS
jgi:hypothetical protein